jgi:acyl-CoA dehydrogenase
VDYCAETCLNRFDQALAGTLDNFPITWAGVLMRPLIFPYGAMRRAAPDKDGKAIVSAALEPGEFRDRLTRDIFITNDPNDRLGLLEHTLLKTVAAEEADKKLERAIRKGEVQRYYNNDWIAEAERKGVVSQEEARSLAELRDLVARVIAVDHFVTSEISGRRAVSQATPGASVQPPDSIAAE